MNEQLLKSSAEKIHKLHLEILSYAQASLGRAVSVGELLIQVKSSMDHGEWLPWLNKSLPSMSVSTVNRYMKCYENKNELLELKVNDLTEAYEAIKALKFVTMTNLDRETPAKVAKTASDSSLNAPATPNAPQTAAISSGAASVAKAEPAIVRDQTGYRIPGAILTLWQRRVEPKSMLQKLSDVRSFVRNLMNERANGRNDVLYQECATHGTLSELDMAYADLKRAIPFAVCPFCQGVNAENCRTCKGRGMISRHMWDQAVPADMKSVRAKSCAPVAHVEEEP